MKLARILAGLATAALVSACSSTTTAPPPTGTVVVFSSPATLVNDGTQAQVTATVTDASGNAGTGSVSFTASAGALNGTGSTATATLVGGMATMTYACDVAVDAAHCGAQTVLVTATWTGLAGGTHITLQGPGGGGGGGGGGTISDAGVTGGGGPAGPPNAIVEVSATPYVLGVNGSGIQENGVMTFSVTDDMGNPVVGTTVNFAQASPALVTLGHATATTNASGIAVVDYVAGTQVGVTSIQATVAATGATTSHPIAVRGARPSAKFFDFRCSKTNLPVYTTTLQHEETTCTVRLADRNGNRVGIATPVSFATEAGVISASALTKPFDYANPTDSEEGSVTVTFSSDMGIGFAPVETTPIAGEPSNGSLNPRDQLVTIIAMVRGEEAFVDANLNGQYDTGEMFTDQGDPFVDSNDNDVYDAATELRFCGGSSCATYNGPNGVWDADRTIWVPTWIAFTGPAVPSLATVPPPGGWSNTCIDYTDNNVPNPISTTATVIAVDEWGNASAAGTTYTATLKSAQSGASLTTFGGFTELENIGSIDVSWAEVSATNPTQRCTPATAPNGICILRTVFGGFDTGARMTLTVTDTNKTPTAIAPAHACGATPTAGSHLDTFNVDVGVTGPHVTTHNSFGAQFAY